MGNGDTHTKCFKINIKFKQAGKNALNYFNLLHQDSFRSFLFVRGNEPLTYLRSEPL